VAGPERAGRSGIVSAVATTESLPEAEPGSTRYFVLLYCPHARRRALATLLAVTAELDVGRARAMDHGVAHLRLDWWQAELQRFARGAPEHPWLSAWLREQPQDHALGLQTLTEAAAIDLASARLAARNERCLAAALFLLAAKLLGIDSPQPQLEQQLRALGRYVAALEQGAIAAAPVPPEAPAQPRLTPLLVWTALAERQAARGPQPAGKLNLLADNFIAWRAARSAQRGCFRIEQTPRGDAA
jgi:Squalene/phytoene synthase